MNVLYLCNGRNTKCKDSISCFVNGGECEHTEYEAYARNGKSDNPADEPERFEKYEYGEGRIFYAEISKGENK